jgi:hypothetical protein
MAAKNAIKLRILRRYPRIHLRRENFSALLDSSTIHRTILLLCQVKYLSDNAAAFPESFKVTGCILSGTVTGKWSTLK